MYTIKLQVNESAFDKIISFLKRLPEKDVKIIEKKKEEKKQKIDFSKYNISAFKIIKDPLEWQKKQREEWER